MKLTRKDVPTTLLKAFPDYKGRKFVVCIAEKYYPQNYWDGGSRNYFKIVNIYTGNYMIPPSVMESPFDPSAHQPIEISGDMCIVEHSIFQGRDMGLRFFINLNNILLNTIWREL